MKDRREWEKLKDVGAIILNTLDCLVVLQLKHRSENSLNTIHLFSASLHTLLLILPK